MKQTHNPLLATKAARTQRGFMGINVVFGRSFLLLAAVFSLTFSLISPMVAQAAPAWNGSNFIADDIYENTSAHQHYYFLYSCFRNNDIDRVERGEMDNWDFFQGSGNRISALGAMYSGASVRDDSQGWRDCDDESLVEQAFRYLGVTSPRQAFCSISGAEYNGSNANQRTCEAGTGDGEWDNNASSATRASSFANQYLARKPSMGGAEQYVRAYQTLVSQRGCDISFSGNRLYTSAGAVPGTNAGNTYAVPVIVEDSAVAANSPNRWVLRYMQGVGINNSDSTGTSLAYVATTGAYGDGRLGNRAQFQSCNDIVNIARNNAGAYLAWVRAHPNAEASDAAGASSGRDEEAASTCSIDGVGWLVCPVVEFLGDLNDQAFEYLSMILRVPSSIITNEGTRTAWSAFRDIANVAFVIALLFIIYSQITGAGISNYGLKKLAPKLIIAALLVNISFWVCAGLVDLSNIVGSGLHSLLSGIQVSGGTSRTAEGLAGIWSTAAPVLLATIGSIGLILLIVLAPTVLLAFALVILILIARQAFVILLIVISPLAFVAYLLPNTEQWFKRWWKAMVAVLMVYPIVALVFGGSTLAANILLSVGSAGADGFADGISPELMQIIGASIMALPLFAVPSLLKGSMSAAGTVGAKLQGIADSRQKASLSTAKRRAGEYSKRYGESIESKMASRGGVIGAVGNYRTRRDFSHKSMETATQRAQQRALSEHVAGNDNYSTRQQAQAVSAIHKMNKEQVDESISLLQDNSPDKTLAAAQKQLIQASQTGDVVAARAATQVLATQTGSKGVEALHETITAIENKSTIEVDGKDIAGAGFAEGTGVRENIQHDVNSSGLKSKDVSLDNWARGGNGSLKQFDTSVTAAGLTQTEIAGQSANQLKRMKASGGLDPASAQRAIDAYASGNLALGGDKLAVLNDVPGVTPHTPGTQPQQTQPPTPSNPKPPAPQPPLYP